MEKLKRLPCPIRLSAQIRENVKRLCRHVTLVTRPTDRTPLVQLRNFVRIGARAQKLRSLASSARAHLRDQRRRNSEPARLRPLHQWLATYERVLNDRLDRLDDYLEDLQRRE